MGNKIAFILPILVILLSALLISYKPTGEPLSKQFQVNLVTPTITAQTTIIPTISLIPSSTINPKNYLTYDKIYTNEQISFLKTHDVFKYISTQKFPPLPAATDTHIPVYMFDCQVTNEDPGIKLVPVIDWIPRQQNVIFQTMNLFAAKGYGEYPTAEEIRAYQKASNLTFKNQIGGVNQVNLDSKGILNINYFDSVRSYGGGSSRLNCMGLASLVTAMQYPTVRGIKQCIDILPTSLDSCPYDFQP